MFRICLISVPSFHGVSFLAWLDEEKQGRMVPAGAPVGESDIRTCAILSPHIVGAGPEEDQDDYNEAQHYWKLILRVET